MISSRRLIGRATVAVAAWCLATPTPFAAERSVQVQRVGCGRGVHVVAHDVPVHAVLAELAMVERFRLSGGGGSSKRVTIDTTRPTQDLLKSMLADESSIVQEAADPECPGQRRVSTVWIVDSTGMPDAANPPPARPRAAAPGPVRPAPAPPAPAAAEGAAAFLRGHGAPAR